MFFKCFHFRMLFEIRIFNGTLNLGGLEEGIGGEESIVERMF